MKEKGKGSNPLEEIKKIEQKREERRLKMEEAKREKEEKKAYNLASGKNVDIDFEIMIEKNKFREKILSPHASSADMKVSLPLFSWQCALEKDRFSKNNKPMDKLTQSHALILKSKFTSLSIGLMVLPNTFKIIHSHSIIHSMNNKYSYDHTEHLRYL